MPVARRGRPPSERARQALKVYVKLRLYPGDDDDLITFVQGVPKGLLASSVKRALRDGIHLPLDGGSDEELLATLDGLVD